VFAAIMARHRVMNARLFIHHLVGACTAAVGGIAKAEPLSSLEVVTSSNSRLLGRDFPGLASLQFVIQIDATLERYGSHWGIDSEAHHLRERAGKRPSRQACFRRRQPVGSASLPCMTKAPATSSRSCEGLQRHISSALRTVTGHHSNSLPLCPSR